MFFYLAVCIFHKNLNPMKTLSRICLVLAILFTIPITAQVSVGKYKFEGIKDFKEGEVELIKTKNTVFVADDIDKAEYETILKEVWKVTPYEFITREQFDKSRETYITEKNALFLFGTDKRSFATMSGSGVSYKHYFYHYFYPTDIENKKGKLKYEVNQIAQLFYTGSGVYQAFKNNNFKNLRKDLYYYSPAYLKNSLTLVNNTLMNSGTVNNFEEILKHPKLKELSTNTLYIPEVFNKSWHYMGMSKKDKTMEGLEEYKYKYEFLDDDAIEKKFSEGKQFYYAYAIVISPYVIMSVIDSETGEVIFRAKKLDKGKIEPHIELLNDLIAKSTKK